jgi:hypothetical protein
VDRNRQSTSAVRAQIELGLERCVGDEWTKLVTSDNSCTHGLRKGRMVTTLN